MLQKICLNTEGSENNTTRISFVHLFMNVFSIVILNRYISSVYPIMLLVAIELVFLLIKKKIAVNYVLVAWLVNIGIIAVRTVTWDQTNIKIFLSYVIGFFFFVLARDTQFRISDIFNKYIKFFIVAIVLIPPLIQEVVPSLPIWGEAGSGIVGKPYYVHVVAFIWLTYCLFSAKIGIWGKTVAVLLIAIVVMLTGSRSNLLTMPVTIGAVYIFGSDKRQTIKHIIKFAVLALMIAVVVYVVGKHFQMDSILRITETIERMLDGRDYSNGRTALAEMALNDFRSAPMWGIGWMNFQDYHVGQNYSNYNVHNFYLQLLCEIGIVGTAFFLIPYAYALFSDIRFIRTTTSAVRRRSIRISLAYQIYFLLSSTLHATSYDSVYILLYFVFITYSCSIKSHEVDEDECCA